MFSEMEKVGRAAAVDGGGRCEINEEDRDDKGEDKKEEDEEEEEEGCCCCCCCCRCCCLARVAARFLRAEISFQKRVSLWRMES